MEADASLQTTAASAAPANRGTNSHWLRRLSEQKRQRTTTFKIINARRYCPLRQRFSFYLVSNSHRVADLRYFFSGNPKTSVGLTTNTGSAVNADISYLYFFS